MYGVVRTHLSIEEYWEFLRINEIAGYGIRNFPTTAALGMGCGDYWDQTDRYFLAASIQKAENRLEADRWLGFPIRRDYGKPRQLSYVPELVLGKYLRGVGIETETLVETVNLTLSVLGAVVDPLVFTVAVSFTDVNELVLKYPSAYYLSNADNYYIRPSSVTITAGVATVEVPRARLLRPEYFKDYKNDNERPNYTVDTNFLDTVEVYRNYLDQTTGANLVWYRHAGAYGCYANVMAVPCNGSIGVCSDVRQLACSYVSAQRNGVVQLEPATYSDGSWTKTSYAIKRPPDGVEINYMRGYTDRYDELDVDLIRAVIAVAHNNLPRDYCHCDQQTLYYNDDTRPLEPPVRLGLGRSTWGLYEAEQIIREYDAKTYGSYGGGLM